MNSDHQAWQRLAAAARRAPPPGDEAAPFGFSTRIAALAMAAPASGYSLFARWSLRALGLACLVAAGAVVANYSAILHPFDAGATPAKALAAAAASMDDPVAEVVDLAS